MAAAELPGGMIDLLRDHASAIEEALPQEKQASANAYRGCVSDAPLLNARQLTAILTKREGQAQFTAPASDDISSRLNQQIFNVCCICHQFLGSNPPTHETIEAALSEVNNAITELILSQQEGDTSKIAVDPFLLALFGQITYQGGIVYSPEIPQNPSILNLLTFAGKMICNSSCTLTNNRSKQTLKLLDPLKSLVTFARAFTATDNKHPLQKPLLPTSTDLLFAHFINGDKRRYAVYPITESTKPKPKNLTLEKVDQFNLRLIIDTSLWVVSDCQTHLSNLMVAMTLTSPLRTELGNPGALGSFLRLINARMGYGYWVDKATQDRFIVYWNEESDIKNRIIRRLSDTLGYLSSISKISGTWAFQGAINTQLAPLNGTLGSLIKQLGLLTKLKASSIIVNVPEEGARITWNTLSVMVTTRDPATSPSFSSGTKHPAEAAHPQQSKRPVATPASDLATPSPTPREKYTIRVTDTKIGYLHLLSGIFSGFTLSKLYGEFLPNISIIIASITVLYCLAMGNSYKQKAVGAITSSLIFPVVSEHLATLYSAYLLASIFLLLGYLVERHELDTQLPSLS